MTTPNTHHDQDGDLILKLNKESKFVIGSTYGSESDEPPFEQLMFDVNELINKPRRFFDTLRIVVAQNAKPKQREFLLECVDLWASAINQGVFEDVLKRARRKPGATCQIDYLNEEVSDKPYEYE